MFQHHTFTGNQTLAASGSTIAYAESSAALAGGDARIIVWADGQAQGLMRPGDVMTLGHQAVSWEIRPLNASISGTVMIGSGAVQLATVGGTVGTIDAAISKVFGGVQAHAGIARTAAAAKFAAIMIGAPPELAAWGYGLSLQSIDITVAAVSDVRVWKCAFTSAVAYVAQQNAYNKRVKLGGFAQTDILIAALNDATVSGASTPDCDVVNLSSWAMHRIVRANTSTPVQLINRTPVFLDPGWALVVVHQAAAGTLTVGCEIDAIQVGSATGTQPQTFY